VDLRRIERFVATRRELDSVRPVGT
jgi:hypothetical protein